MVNNKIQHMNRYQLQDGRHKVVSRTSHQTTKILHLRAEIMKVFKSAAINQLQASFLSHNLIECLSVTYQK